MNYLNVLLIVFISYLLGSIPTAYLIAKYKRVDIFDVGSGNMGATNVSRAIGLKWGLLVWFLDSAKGMIAIAIAWRIMPDHRHAAATIAGLVAIIGHNWSLFATMITGKLRGGKGAATAFGTLLMVAPVQTLVIGFAISSVIVFFTRYMSLGVLVMFTMSMVWIAILSFQRQLPAEFIYYASIMWGMLVVRFRENIQRLLSGTERRLGEPT
jgi:acyl phosphate:glycerol-3-phosphate acyltransferase